MIHGVIRAGVLASTAPTIVLLAAVLVVVGIALVVVGVRLLRRTRSDPAALGPLEEMGERGWRSADEVHRGELLDRARPAGAEPIAVAAVVAPSAAEVAAAEPVAEKLRPSRTSRWRSQPVEPRGRRRARSRRAGCGRAADAPADAAANEADEPATVASAEPPEPGAAVEPGEEPGVAEPEPEPDVVRGAVRRGARRARASGRASRLARCRASGLPNHVPAPRSTNRRRRPPTRPPMPTPNGCRRRVPTARISSPPRIRRGRGAAPGVAASGTIERMAEFDVER